jgi:hypothetical protein|eukprot:SAG25_NODE_1086_length_4076_cov_1.856676_4_plen_52_part_00
MHSRQISLAAPTLLANLMPSMGRERQDVLQFAHRFHPFRYVNWYIPGWVID